jgi:tetratricopeptide (TPR) repeat protein
VLFLSRLPNDNLLYGQNTGGQQTGPANSQQQPDSSPDDPPEEEVKWPKLSEMTLPTAAELLQGPHLDWIVLLTDEVIVCEPVYPRPNTLEKLQTKIDALRSSKGRRNLVSVEDRREALEELRNLIIVLPGDYDAPEYRLHMKYVAEIRHHEDLMLRRVDVLLNDGKLRDAFEMLFVLERSHSGWPGYAARHQRLLFLEADKDFQNKRIETALVTLEELHNTNRQFEGLKPKLGEVVDRLIDDAVNADDFRRGRHYLFRLRRREPKHPIVSQWVSRLRDQSSAAINRADQLYRDGQYAEAAVLSERATIIWPNAPGLPSTPNLVSIHNRLSSRYPRVNVGVVKPPGQGAVYFLPTAADRRHRFLTQTTLFEVDHTDDAPHYRSRLLEQWEPTDLGHRAVFTLRQNRSSWESQEVVTATSVMSTFADRLDPSSTAYDERLDSFVSSVSVLSPFRFEVRFSRVPLHIESLLTLPVTRSGGGIRAGGFPMSRVANETQPVDAPRLVSRRFVLHEHSEGRVVFRRAVAEPQQTYQFHVAEVIERSYPSHGKAVQGLLRGEVAMLPQVQSKDIAPLQDDERFRVVETALPVTHLLQFNPRGRVARNRELRRALAYALDRERILHETVLDDPKGTNGRVVSGPFATRGLSANKRRFRGFAYNPDVKLRRYDRTLAISLAMAAGKAYGGDVPELKLICVPEPIALSAAGRLIQQWSRAGIKVKLLIGSDSTIDPVSGDWDIIYRTVRMTQPIVELWPLLTLEPTARVASLFYLPDWLRQELIELDHTGDWKSAVEKLQDLHAHLAASVFLIPLWELDDFVVFRRNIRGYPDTPLHVYQRIERWTIKPSIQTDLP